jgi:hypothetical protein
LPTRDRSLVYHAGYARASAALMLVADSKCAISCLCSLKSCGCRCGHLNFSRTFLACEQHGVARRGNALGGQMPQCYFIVRAGEGDAAERAAELSDDAAALRLLPQNRKLRVDNPVREAPH